MSKPTKEQQEASVRAINRTCKGPFLTDASGHPIGDLRTGCGYDVNNMIIEAGLDGKMHAGQCPQCKLVIEWTAPRFD